jgi:SAM-dependent methyltransferase
MTRAPRGSVAFDRAAGYYDQTRGLPPAVAEQVADRIDAAAGTAAPLLEIGVGTGRVALPLHRRGRRIAGVDLSAPMMARYRAKAGELGLGPPLLAQADAARLPFRERTFGAVLEVHVLHLVPAWRAALAEMRRVLADTGVVLVGRGGGHQRQGSGPHGRVLTRFEELAAALGGPPRHVGADRDRDKLDALAALGGVAEPLEPVVWEQPETHAQALAWVEGRVFSYLWRLPEWIWRAATERLRAELAAAGVDLTAAVPTRHEFRLTAVRFDRR